MVTFVTVITTNFPITTSLLVIPQYGRLQKFCKGGQPQKGLPLGEKGPRMMKRPP